MLLPRLIVCLDVDAGRVVKGTRFQALREVGEPAALAARYEAEGADEIVFLDVSASREGRATLLETVRRTAERLFIPLTVGGGVRSVDDAADVLRAGADKVSVNTAAVERPELVADLSSRFGAQCVVASVDAVRRPDRGYRVATHGGSRPTDLDAVEWAGECAERGAGEILLTSVDRDGTREGYDLALLEAVASRVTVPVIASGGAGTAEHLARAFDAGAAAALVAGIVHEGRSVAELKRELARLGLALRPVATP